MKTCIAPVAHLYDYYDEDSMHLADRKSKSQRGRYVHTSQVMAPPAAYLSIATTMQRSGQTICCQHELVALALLYNLMSMASHHLVAWSRRRPHRVHMPHRLHVRMTNGGWMTCPSALRTLRSCPFSVIFSAPWQLLKAFLPCIRPQVFQQPGCTCSLLVERALAPASLGLP